MLHRTYVSALTMSTSLEVLKNPVHMAQSGLDAFPQDQALSAKMMTCLQKKELASLAEMAGLDPRLAPGQQCSEIFHEMTSDVYAALEEGGPEAATACWNSLFPIRDIELVDIIEAAPDGVYEQLIECYELYVDSMRAELRAIASTP
jgi:hypothetical protein